MVIAKFNLHNFSYSFVRNFILGGLGIAILGLLIFNEFPDSWTLLGLLIVVLSGLYIWQRELKIANSADPN